MLENKCSEVDIGIGLEENRKYKQVGQKSNSIESILAHKSIR